LGAIVVKKIILDGWIGLIGKTEGTTGLGAVLNKTIALDPGRWGGRTIKAQSASQSGLIGLEEVVTDNSPGGPLQVHPAPIAFASVRQVVKDLVASTRASAS